MTHFHTYSVRVLLKSADSRKFFMVCSKSLTATSVFNETSQLIVILKLISCGYLHVELNAISVESSVQPKQAAL